jgi:RHS repeat-associated protein
MNDYYPFGMTYNSYSVSSMQPNVLLGGGKEVQDELAIGFTDFGARMYMPEIGRWNGLDLMADNKKNLPLSPYQYANNNPVLYVDPFGLDWFRHDESGATLWNESTGATNEFEGQTFQNVGQRFAWTGTVYDENGVETPIVTIGNADGTTRVLVANEFGLGRFPERGNGFARYSHGLADVYTLNNETAPQAHGDNWAHPRTAASFFNLIQEWTNVEPGITLHYGDISAYDPSINLGHQTHTQGRAIDIHYFTETGGELEGNQSYLNGDVCAVSSFMTLSSQYGFTSNYSYGNRYNHEGNTNHSAHDDHFHIGHPNQAAPVQNNVVAPNRNR